MLGSINTLILGVLLLFYQTSNAQFTKVPLFVGHPERIHTMDSLIEKAENFALQKNDYKQNFELALNAGSKSDSLITNVAISFFTHLAYGNQVIHLEYEGVKLKPNIYNVPALVKNYVAYKSLNKLVAYFMSSSKDVSKILSTLKLYRDSVKKDSAKIELLAKAANDFRWLNAVKQENRIIVVNIPSAQLRTYDQGKLILSMKVVVGKIATQTNTLSAQVNQITIYPYWTVPKTIATKEMLPKIKKDIKYLDSNHLQILNASNKIKDPNTIHWGNYSEENFPFTIRQGTGCDNSLGLIKVEFDSPFGIYLHDTPEKGLFANTNRFYSHGCMRMEKPIDMGKWLLQNNSVAIDTIDFNKCPKDPIPKSIPITLSTKIIVWYSLVDFDKNGNLKFYKNIYEK